MRWHISDTNGTVIAGVQGSNGILVNAPQRITLDQWKNLYVTDFGNHRIQLFCNGSSTGIILANYSVSAPVVVVAHMNVN